MAGHPRFTGDIWNVHNLWLTYSLMVDVRNVHVSRLTYRAHQHCGRWSEHQNQQGTDKKLLSAIGINFPTPSSTT